ncbi:hypothetical protein [Rhodococcus ruber]|uniref:hypothetical protein n=1 Tax=Rhodococcus ruber TaxID=1830 RepID=UPI000743EEA0|nr:hypothetical protein [Rhodococcus ruber]MDO1481588.1 hypothetical protein [Rhodococcus ruber]
MARRSEWKPLLDAVTTSGWTYRRCKHGLYIYPADRTKRPITVPGTPGDHRAVRNARADLRRAGLTRL